MYDACKFITLNSGVLPSPTSSPVVEDIDTTYDNRNRDDAMDLDREEEFSINVDSDDEDQEMDPDIARMVEANSRIRELSRPMETALDVWEHYYNHQRNDDYSQDMQLFRAREAARYRTKGIMQMHPESTLVYKRNQGFCLGTEDQCFLCYGGDKFSDGVDISFLNRLHQMMWDRIATDMPFELANKMHLLYMHKIFKHNQNYPMLTVEKCQAHIEGGHTLDPALWLANEIRKQTWFVEQIRASVIQADGVVDEKKHRPLKDALDYLYKLRTTDVTKMTYYNVSSMGDPNSKVGPTNLVGITSRRSKAKNKGRMYIRTGQHQ